MSKISIIPIPVSLKSKEGVFQLNQHTKIISSNSHFDIAEIFSSWIKASTGYEIPIILESTTNQNTIMFELSSSLDHLGNEGYRLTVDSQSIMIQANAYSGLVYGAQSLRQLLPNTIFSTKNTHAHNWEIPCVEIIDKPRFTWRGAMLDVARHYMPVEFIYKFLDLLSIHKLNTFHWHLTEDQGWRIEIKKYPRLNEVGSWRDETMVGHYRDNKDNTVYDNKRHGGFYTQEDIKKIIHYASRLGINIVPEIEMPGHAQAAIAAYPELGNTGEQLGVSKGWGIHEHVFNVEDSTLEFLKNVLAEVLEIFPSKFIHIGGDEVPKREWKESLKAQKKMQELGLQNEDELQSYVIHQIDTFLTEKNRRLIGWDEILEGGLAPNATVMSWRGEAGGISAAQAGHDVVMAPNTFTYFDYYQSDDKTNEPLAIGGYLPLEVVYSYDPIPNTLSTQQQHHILGTQAQIWTEYIPNPSKVEYMAYPRLCALTEVAWSPKENKNFDNFIERLSIHLKRLDQIPVNYRKI